MRSNKRNRNKFHPKNSLGYFCTAAALEFDKGSQFTAFSKAWYTDRKRIWPI
jgi:hypothetical protein